MSGASLTMSAFPEPTGTCVSVDVPVQTCSFLTVEPSPSAQLGLYKAQGVLRGCAHKDSLGLSIPILNGE